MLYAAEPLCYRYFAVCRSLMPFIALRCRASDFIFYAFRLLSSPLIFDAFRHRLPRHAAISDYTLALPLFFAAVFVSLRRMFRHDFAFCGAMLPLLPPRFDFLPAATLASFSTFAFMLMLRH